MHKPLSEDQALAQALELHRGGKLGPAIRAYEEIVRRVPRNAAAQRMLGIACFQDGQLKRAATALSRALELDPSLPEAHYNLGIVLHRLGRYEEAVQHHERAVAARPDDAEALLSLGAALKELGRYEEAVERYRQALAINNSYAEAHCNLAGALLALDRPEEAAEHYSKALALKPGFADAHLGLGNAFLALQRHKAAAEQFEFAIAVNPNHAAAHAGLGEVLVAFGREDEALPYYDKALILEPDNSDTHYHRAEALRRLRRYEEARRDIERALALAPGSPEGHRYMGELLDAIDRPEEANGWFERAIALAPRSARTYLSLVNRRRMSTDDPHFAAVEALAQDIDELPESEQLTLHFALGKIYRDVGDHERSFVHVQAGNALARRRFPANEDQSAVLAARIRSIFTPDLLRTKSGRGDPSPLPIFVVGMPRSGKTALERILARHPRIASLGERTDFERAVSRLEKLKGLDYPEIVEVLSGDELAMLGATYVNAARAAAPEAERTIDTLPGNSWHVGLIHLALPNARILHMRRDPVQTCLACFAKFFGRKYYYTYDLSSLGHYYRAYDEAMTHWRSVLPDGVMLDVRYDEVVHDLEAQLRHVFEHCGLEWHEACLDGRTPEPPSVVWRPDNEVLRPLLEALEAG